MQASAPPELTPASISASVCSALHLQPPLSCVRIHEGSDHNVWRVGADLILRGLPTTAENTTWLQQDIALRRLVQQHIRTPSIIAAHLTTIPIGPWTCNIDRRVPGINLDDPRARASRATEDDLAAFLAHLRAIPPAHIARLGIPPKDPPDFHVHVERGLAAWSALRDAGYLWDPGERVAAMVRGQQRRIVVLGCEEEECGRRRGGGGKGDDEHEDDVFLHADLKGEHVFVDPRTGRVTGVIDWGDACVGDGFFDVAGVVVTVGRIMGVRIAERAGVPARGVQRGVLWAMCEILLYLEGRICGDDEAPEAVLRRQFENAFEGMERGWSLGQ